MLRNFIICMLLILSSVVTVNAAVKCGSLYVELEGFDARFTHDCFHSQVVGSDCQDCESRFFSVPHRNSWEYRIALGYDYLPCNPCYYGWSLEYSHFDVKNDYHFCDENGFLVSGASFLSPFTQACCNIRPSFDTVDALGHFHHVANACFEGELFGGLRFMRLNERTHEHFEGDDSSLIIGNSSLLASTLERHIKNEYQGLGLEAGAKGNYLFYRGFGVTAMASGCLLVGNQRTSVCADFVNTLISNPSSDSLQECQRENNHWVPGFSAKLGLMYHGCLGCQRLVLEGGYRLDRYFHVIRGIEFVSSCPCDQTPQAFARTDRRDVEFHGPYITLAWHF